MPKLVLLRHGLSVWNYENRFTGWTDVDLSDQGVAEAVRAGEALRAEAEVDPTCAITSLHTSVLTRAVKTANFALDAAERSWVQVKRHWRLNERHYGDLQGKNKAESAKIFGDEQVHIWRRSYSTPPAPLEITDERHPANDPKYRHVPKDQLPATESLKDVVERLIPYWVDQIAPELFAGETVLVTAHGNSLRAMVKYLDGVSDEDIMGIEIPTGVPLLYDLDQDLKPVSSRYLGKEN